MELNRLLIGDLLFFVPLEVEGFSIQVILVICAVCRFLGSSVDSAFSLNS